MKTHTRPLTVPFQHWTAVSVDLVRWGNEAETMLIVMEEIKNVFANGMIIFAETQKESPKTLWN